jgi:hypothetical protein
MAGTVGPKLHEATAHHPKLLYHPFMHQVCSRLPRTLSHELSLDEEFGHGAQLVSTAIEAESKAIFLGFWAYSR